MWIQYFHSEITSEISAAGFRLPGGAGKLRMLKQPRTVRRRIGKFFATECSAAWKTNRKMEEPLYEQQKETNFKCAASTGAGH